MKKIFVIANWKSHKTILQSEEWFRTFNSLQLTINRKKETVICLSFTLLAEAKELIVNGQLSNVKLGAQNISPFEEGSYTGEVNGSQIKEFAEYVIVGHSERRKNFAEDEEMIGKKLNRAKDSSLIPILCISDINQVENYTLYARSYTLIVAYEPLFAIGSGNADTPENANEVAGKIKDILGDIPVLYGGSVSSENVASFTLKDNIDGVLVGKASLDAKEFGRIINQA
jgi:triosephosphate isomerase (TIM)